MEDYGDYPSSKIKDGKSMEGSVEMRMRMKTKKNKTKRSALRLHGESPTPLLSQL